MDRTLRRGALRAAIVVLSVAAVGGAPSDPTALLLTGLIDAPDRSKVESGAAIVAVLPAHGPDLSIFGITRIDAVPERLAAWSRHIEQLYTSRYMPAIGRFSSPPRLEDLAALTLDDDDLRDLRKCRVGDCGVKLSAPEIAQVREAADAGGETWKDAVQLAFRRIILARAQNYLVTGLAGALPYQDRAQPRSPAREFAEIASRSELEPFYGEGALPYFLTYPAAHSSSVESFLYWSKETLGGGKPIVSVTHVALFANPYPLMPDAVVAARQVYASHYLTASLSFTIVTGSGAASPPYLVYIRGSRTDAFEGTFGRLVRSIVERRIRSEAPAALDALRRKLEAGDPVSGSR